MVVACTALFTSICALYLSVEQVRIMRIQQKATMYPYLTIGKVYNADGFGIRLKNSGNGLAKINSYQIYNDSIHFKDWVEVVQILAPEAKRINYSVIKTSGGIQNEIITADEQIDLIFLQWTDETKKLEKVVQSLKVKICYSSLLDDHWLINNHTPVELGEPCRMESSKEFNL